jgi:two-component system cell cycle response regulator
MKSQTHVAIVGGGTSGKSGLVDRLGALGCSVFTVTPEDAPLEAVRTRGPHVVILDPGDTTNAALDAARLLKGHAETKHTPIILVRENCNGGLPDDALNSSVDSIITGEFRDIELYTRVRALARLNVMQSELARRGDTQRRYGLSRDPVSQAPVGEVKVAILVAGDLGADAKTLADAIGGESCVTVTSDPQDTIEKLNTRSFDALVVSVDGPDDPWLTMCSDIRDNPRLFHLPILLIADPDGVTDPSLPYEKGATDVLFQPIQKDELGARLKMLIRQQRYRRCMQAAYRRSLHLETSDSLTGLFNFGFLHDYLTSLTSDAGRWNKRLTVGIFDVEGMAELNRKYGYSGGDRLLRQVGGFIGRLVRGEDLTARYGGEEFCVVMPETPCDVAEVALRRVTDVIGQTEFGVHSVGTPVMVNLNMGCAAYEPGDNAESLIERARAAAA